MSTAFDRQLARFGPDATFAAPPLATARSYCYRLARTHYENFSVATLLLPRRLAPHFHAVYSWCRWADDLADETGGRSLELLRWWREELQRCYDGSPRHPVTIALRETIREFDLPRRHFHDLLFAFEQDQLVKRYATFEQLLEYCRRSANPVGRIVLRLIGATGAKAESLSDAICTGLQLANFWQDVARDLDIGRVYLPDQDRRRFGYSDDDLFARRFTPAFVQLMRFEVSRSRESLLRGLPLVDQVPADVRRDIELFARGGLAILDRIERQGYDVWSQRPALSRLEKVRLLIGAWWQHRRHPWRAA